MRTSASTDRARRALLAGALALAAALGACSTTRPAPAEPAARTALAPSGTLRIGVYPGSPTSLVKAAPPEDMRGVTVEVGRALAARLGVPAQVVVYPRLAEVLAALQRGEADFTVTNATAERAKLVDFADPVVTLELGVLVPAHSRVQSVETVDQPGVTVGVSQGSSSQRVLGARYRQAKLRAFPSLAAAGEALNHGEIDAFATNKGILFQLADRVPGARVLPGRWGAEHLAPAIPKGREAGLPFLKAFTQEARSDGTVQRAAERAGLRGMAHP